MKHDADESSFGICAQNIPSSDATPRGGNHESNTSGDASAPLAAREQRVSPLRGDAPGGSLDRLGEPSRYLTVVWNASMKRAAPSAMSRDYTCLVGLRGSMVSLQVPSSKRRLGPVFS